MKETGIIMQKIKGNFFIVSAPSGAGKTTLCQRLIADLPDIQLSVSYTTRKPRKGEINDRDYTFIDASEFYRMIESGAFIEWAEVHGNYYGTSRERLEARLVEGIDVVLDIDVQGAKQMRTTCSKGVYIFILPPSLEILMERLQTRMSNSPEDIRRRMKSSVKEIKEYKTYDYVILNDSLDKALTELKAVIIADRVRTERAESHWIKNFNLQEE